MKAQPSWGSAASAYQGIFGCDKVIRKVNRAVSSLTRVGNWEAGRIAEALQQDTQLPFSGSLLCTQRKHSVGQRVSTAHEQVQYGYRASTPERSPHAYDPGSGSIWPSQHTAETEQFQSCG